MVQKFFITDQLLEVFIMLVSLANMLADANERNYAVIAANAYNYDSARALIKAAELERSPLIINVAEGHLKRWIKRDCFALEIGPMCEAATVPVCINLDHGFTWDVIVACVCQGFTSVMADSSAFPYEENIARTKKVVDVAHARGISVEAELGHVGQGTNAEVDTVSNLTDPAQAADFVERTGVDALAVAVGTAHGEYPKGFVPKLDFDRIREIKAACPIPLVLHGGSGSGDENLAYAAKIGINKINIFTDNQANARTRIYDAIAASEKQMYPLDMIEIIMDGITEKTRYFMQLFGSSNKADDGKFEHFVPKYPIPKMGDL